MSSTTEEADALGSVWVLWIVIWTPKQFVHKLPDPSVGSSGTSQQGTRIDPESCPGHRSLWMSPRPGPLGTLSSSVTRKIVLHDKASQPLACKDLYVLLSCFERVSKWSRQLSLRNPKIRNCLKLNLQKTKIMASDPITSWQIDRETVEQRQTLFLGAPKSLQMVIAAMKLKDTYSLEEKLWPT